ncbi:MAG: class I SAM-dependent methyltransferase, partial [Bacteroidota bacterium]|nr:class I SAM-dependent methyltransferase [Bacteroidota bacterium]
MDLLADHITHYRRDAEEFDYFEEPSPLNRDASRRIRQAVMREARLPNSGLVLDAGSGNGWLTEALHGTECLVVSVDLGLRNLERIRRERPDALCVCADLYRLPFRNASFDRVVCSEVLEHANDPEAVVAACAAVLKPGGRLTVSTPYR